MANDDLTDFGNANVPKSEKTLLVKNIVEEGLIAIKFWVPKV